MLTPYTFNDHKLYIVANTDAVFDVSQGATDTGFTVSFDNDSVTFEESPKGETQFHRRIIKKSTITLSLNWGAIGNQYLTQAFNDQQNGRYLKNCFVKRVSETENTLVYSSAGSVFLMKPADSVLGAAAGPREWTIHVGSMVAEERTVIPA